MLTAGICINLVDKDTSWEHVLECFFSPMQGFEAKAFLWALAALGISGSTLPLDHFSICEGVYITWANTELSFPFLLSIQLAITISILRSTYSIPSWLQSTCTEMSCSFMFQNKTLGGQSHLTGFRVPPDFTDTLDEQLTNLEEWDQ